MVGLISGTKNLNPNPTYHHAGRPLDIGTQVKVRQRRYPLTCGKGPQDALAEKPAQKETYNVIATKMLNHLDYGMLDDAKDLLKEHRAELVEWLSKDEYTPNVFAKKMENHAKRRCHMVPQIAEFMIKMLAAAGRLENIRNIAADSNSDEIAIMADKEIARMKSKNPE